MKPGTKVENQISNRCGTVLTAPYLPDNGGFDLVVDVCWTNGNRSTVAVRNLRAI